MSNSTSQVRFLLAISASFLAFACAHRLPDRAPLSVSPADFGAREQRAVSNVVVLADASGSTYMQKTFPEVKQLSQGFVKALPAKTARGPRTYNGGFIGFGGDERVAAPLASFDRAALSSAAGRNHIMGQPDGTGGTTNIHAVIGEAAAQLEGKSGKTAIVLFSDGVASQPKRALAAAEALVASRSEPVCFHGVQVGDKAEGRAFLQQLAALTPCGSVRSASEVSSASALQSYAKNVMAGKAEPVAKPTPPPTDTACTGTIRLRGIEFGFDKAVIDPVGTVVLDAAAATLAKCPNIAVSINGHTDSVGADAYNQALSERRANSVRSYLLTKGIPARRMTTRGFGESQPVADNRTKDGRARNRRVELKPQ